MMLCQSGHRPAGRSGTTDCERKSGHVGPHVWVGGSVSTDAVLYYIFDDNGLVHSVPIFFYEMGSSMEKHWINSMRERANVVSVHQQQQVHMHDET